MFKIFRKNCCGLDVHKTWIYACIGITDANGLTEYKQARFSSFSKGLRDLADWLAKYSCTEVCMESTGKYWISVFNILEKSCSVTLAHPKYTKPQKGTRLTVRMPNGSVTSLCVTWSNQALSRRPKSGSFVILSVTVSNSLIC